MVEQEVLSDISHELFALWTETEGIQAYLDEFAVIAARRFSSHHDVSCAITDTTTDARWPSCLSRLDTAHVRSILGVSFTLENSGYAALNLYSEEPDAFAPTAIEAAEALVEVTSSSLRFALRSASAQDERHDLEAALVSRRIINTAVGVIMFQNNCSQTEAMDVLQHASSSHNMKLRLVAERVVEFAGRTS